MTLSRDEMLREVVDALEAGNYRACRPVEDVLLENPGYLLGEEQQ